MIFIKDIDVLNSWYSAKQRVVKMALAAKNM